jgi:hypothetical protein
MAMRRMTQMPVAPIDTAASTSHRARPGAAHRPGARRALQA